VRVFENRAMKKIFGPDTEKVGALFRKLHNADPSNLPIPSLQTRVTGLKVGRDGNILCYVWRKEKNSFGKTKHRKEYNIERDFKEKRTENMIRIDLAQDRDKWGITVKAVTLRA